MCNRVRKGLSIESIIERAFIHVSRAGSAHVNKAGSALKNNRGGPKDLHLHQCRREVPTSAARWQGIAEQQKDDVW